MGQAENETKKKSFLSVPSRFGVGNSKKIAKKFKKLKNFNTASSQAKRDRGGVECEEKNSRSDPFQPDP